MHASINATSDSPIPNHSFFFVSSQKTIKVTRPSSWEIQISSRLLTTVGISSCCVGISSRHSLILSF